MSRNHATLAVVALAFAAAAVPAQAGQAHARGLRHPHLSLPPLSGTLHLEPDSFGRGHTGRRYLMEGHHFARHLGWGRTYAGYDAAPRTHWGYGQGSVYWNRSVPFYGEGNDTLALTVTGWGTADSATTGGAYPPPSPRYHSAEPVHFSYGTPYVSSAGYNGGGSGGGYGYAPTGGLGYYNSGSPGRLAYYSSGSSAGPGGTPGGLGIYSSGSFGPGPRVLTYERNGAAQWSRGAAGPRIIHLHPDGLTPG